MKKFFQFIFIMVCIFVTSCSNLYQDFSSTLINISPEFISNIKRTTSLSDLNINVCINLDKTDVVLKQTKNISRINVENGVSFLFERLPVNETGTVSVYITTNEFYENDFVVNNLAKFGGKTQFTVKAKDNYVKVDVNSIENYEAMFYFYDIEEDTFSYISSNVNFTENSSVTAPLPLGTTKWSVYHNDNGTISYYGFFDETIDIENGLMNYKDYFVNPSNGENNLVILEATGEPEDKITTPIVYSEAITDEQNLVNYKYHVIVSSDKDEQVLFTSDSEITDYCFDNAGNLYILMNKLIHKIAYNHKENMYEEFDESIDSFAKVEFDYISYDISQNALYGLKKYYNANGMLENISLTKFLNPAGSIYKEQLMGNQSSVSILSDVFYPSTVSMNTVSNEKWAVANGILYLASVNNNQNYTNFTNEYKLQIVYYDSSTETSGTVEKDLISTQMAQPQNFTTDLIYQDNNFYVIFSCYNTNWNTSECYSTGGILKFDTTSNEFNENFGIKGFAGAKEITVGSYNTTVSYNSPTVETENTEFYGPKQFVAIMPKKLVFSDYGVDVSSYDEKNQTSIPSKARLVEYDLSTNSFSSTDISTMDLGFNFTGFSF